jgi:nitrate reductase assembly molybdenum cofactor insertion protein NarJ
VREPSKLPDHLPVTLCIIQVMGIAQLHEKLHRQTQSVAKASAVPR